MAKKVKGLELKLGKIVPMEVAAELIGTAVETTEDALKARVILKEALDDFKKLIETEDAKLDKHITPEKVEALGEKVVVEIEERVRYSFSKGTTKKVKLDPKYARNEDLYQDHPELVNKKETVIYELKKDVDDTIQGAVIVEHTDVVKQAKRKVGK